jgi:uncharacterized membrane protein
MIRYAKTNRYSPLIVLGIVVTAFLVYASFVNFYFVIPLIIVLVLTVYWMLKDMKIKKGFFTSQSYRDIKQELTEKGLSKI